MKRPVVLSTPGLSFSHHSENLPPRYHYDPAVLVVPEPLAVMEFSSRSGVHGPSDHRMIGEIRDLKTADDCRATECRFDPGRGNREGDEDDVAGRSCEDLSRRDRAGRASSSCHLESPLARKGDILSLVQDSLEKVRLFWTAATFNSFSQSPVTVAVFDGKRGQEVAGVSSGSRL